MTRQIVATGLCALFVLGSVPLGAQTGLISGHARSEARRPYYNYSVQARDVHTGLVVATDALDPATADFELIGLAVGRFVVELLDDDGDVVCTEGPFDLLAGSMSETGVHIACSEPWAWLLLAGIVAGVTAGVAALPAASGNQ